MPNSSPHALVTGSSSGIGLAIALALLDAGWRVTGFDRAAPALLHEAFAPVQVDLSDGAATDAAARGLDGVSAFVHAAGVLRVGRLGALDAAGGALMWRLHVEAATRLADVLVPRMAEAGHGRVVIVGSRVAQGKAGRSQYAASKAALVALARSWAAEVAPRGVTVNVVSPAATQTAMTADPSRASEAPVLPPIGRLIRPEEIAALVRFLLSSEADAITGQDIQICGGSSLPR
ncbi:SDR family NAD(P)-dependent oxidoreductase [Variovorax sp. JS1663]|uniref:SDR family NAD(P)-dependent oxidoreductase n=1 Tax=Variovorax sp. JS1663 TaxID=1851577 RepID=UPI000B3496B7|nr:SDR family oxidoreductase [Variovorax sp. JS1663]OUL98861.1 3-oxoacyl-ACP reductase [Variovorax sp. JS1663]